MARPNRDQAHLDTLRDYLACNAVLPSYAKLGEVLGFQGKAGAYKLAQRLIPSGYLDVVAGSRLVPTDRFFELPAITSRLPAGTWPALPLDAGVERHQLDRLLVDHPSRTVLLPVRDDSMADVGILDGDTAVVERTTVAHRGDYVAALVDEQYTVKELWFEEGRPVLLPRSPHYEKIVPCQELEILGVVIGIVRRYGSRSTAKPVQGEAL